MKYAFSFVIPVYNADNILYRLLKEIQKVMLEINLTFEIIFVDDRSTDNSWEILKRISEEWVNIKCIRLSRNFGQHPAIMAGLSQVVGEWIVVMDCDLQDQPKEVVKLYSKILEGYDIVLAKRRNRQDKYFKRVSSIIFSKIFGFFTDTEYDNEIANFGIYKFKVIQAILKISDSIKYFPLFVNFVGFRSTSIIVEHAKRIEGSSGYSLSKLLSLAFNTIISFSNKPLKIFVKFGLIISCFSFLSGVYNIYLALTHQIEVLGYSSIIISIWFLSGVIITTTGVTGIYVGKIFDQTKGRPVFIVDEILNNKNQI